MNYKCKKLHVKPRIFKRVTARIDGQSDREINLIHNKLYHVEKCLKTMLEIATKNSGVCQNEVSLTKCYCN